MSQIKFFLHVRDVHVVEPYTSSSMAKTQDTLCGSLWLSKSQIKVYLDTHMMWLYLWLSGSSVGARCKTTLHVLQVNMYSWLVSCGYH